MAVVVGRRPSPGVMYLCQDDFIMQQRKLRGGFFVYATPLDLLMANHESFLHDLRWPSEKPESAAQLLQPEKDGGE